MTTIKPRVQIKNLQKKTSSTLIADEISLNLHPKEVFVLVGPKSSGKTLLAKMVLNLVHKTHGEVKFTGTRADIGSVLDGQHFIPNSTPFKTLVQSATFNGREVNDKHILNVLNLLGLKGLKRKKIKVLAQNQVSRLKVANAIFTKPQVLILDNPFEGLTDEESLGVRLILRALADHLEIAVLITSPTLEGVEEICDTIGIINDGLMVTVKSYNELAQRAGVKGIAVLSKNPVLTANVIETELNLPAVPAGDKVIVQTNIERAQEVYNCLVKNNVLVFGVERVDKTITEIYFSILNERKFILH